MRRYTQLAREQRYQIYAIKKAGHSQTKIAEVLGVHKATISRELKRNCGQRGYRPKQAQQLTQKRHREKPSKRITAETWSLIESYLRIYWSPEQISGWLCRTGRHSVSHERIYQYVLADKGNGGDLYNIFVVKNNARNVMAPEIVAAIYLIGDASRPGLPL